MTDEKKSKSLFLTFIYDNFGPEAREVMEQIIDAINTQRDSAIIGAAGCGKSTFLELIRKYLLPEGSCNPELEGVATIEALFGMIPQQSRRLATPIFAKYPYVFLDDITSGQRGLRSNDVKTFGNLHRLLDTKNLRIPFAIRVGGYQLNEAPEDCEYESYGVTFDWENGVISYSFEGHTLFLAMTYNTYEDMVEAKEDFETMLNLVIIDEEISAAIFDWVVDHGFMEGVNIPPIPEELKEPIKRIFPQRLKTLRELCNFAKDLNGGGQDSLVAFIIAIKRLLDTLYVRTRATRRFSETSRRHQEAKFIREQLQENISAYLSLDCGLTNAEIGRRLGKTRQTVHNWLIKSRQGM